MSVTLLYLVTALASIATSGVFTLKASPFSPRTGVRPGGDLRGDPDQGL